MAEWICRWKPFWIPFGDTFQKAYLEEWQLVDDGSKRMTPSKTLHKQFLAPLLPKSYGRQKTETVPSSMSNPWTPHRHRNPHGKQLESLMRLLGRS